MNPMESLTELNSQDAGLRWTMRLIGIVLAVACILLIQQDIVTSGIAVVFFSIGAALGVFTFVSSLLPASKKTVEEKPVFQPISTRDLTQNRS